MTSSVVDFLFLWAICKQAHARRTGKDAHLTIKYVKNINLLTDPPVKAFGATFLEVK